MSLIVPEIKSYRILSQTKTIKIICPQTFYVTRQLKRYLEKLTIQNQKKTPQKRKLIDARYAMNEHA